MDRNEEEISDPHSRFRRFLTISRFRNLHRAQFVVREARASLLFRDPRHFSMINRGTLFSCGIPVLCPFPARLRRNSDFERNFPNFPWTTIINAFPLHFTHCPADPEWLVRKMSKLSRPRSGWVGLGVFKQQTSLSTSDYPRVAVSASDRVSIRAVNWKVFSNGIPCVNAASHPRRWCNCDLRIRRQSISQQFRSSFVCKCRRVERCI